MNKGLNKGNPQSSLGVMSVCGDEESGGEVIHNCKGGTGNVLPFEVDSLQRRDRSSTGREEGSALPLAVPTADMNSDSIEGIESNVRMNKESEIGRSWADVKREQLNEIEDAEELKRFARGLIRHTEKVAQIYGFEIRTVERRGC